MKAPGVPIALEGYPFICFSVFATLVFGLLELTVAASCGILITGFVTWFFRDPERTVPDDPNVFIAPADGKVILVEKIFDDRFTNMDVHKVSIFMNIFNVHVNRIPYPGIVEKITLQPGRFYSADSQRGALHNEYCAMTIKAESIIRYGVVQMAGLVARRIVCWAEKGDRVAAGRRYGLIRFGSRVDLYLPLEVEITVRRGEKVRAGESIIGILQPGRHD
jgi:phosphatidylserine decarboxylase